MSLFKFKQFTIQQDKCAMKVGTDAVLLGAWVTIKNNTNSILDIGSGTGLIALQMAQRSESEVIDAIEIEPEAFEQTVENFEASNWSDRLFCYHTSLQNFAEEIGDKYDLIVSNPPFYDGSYQTENKARNLARYTLSLTYEELLSYTAKLLSAEGQCAFIIPFIDEDNFINIAQSEGLFYNRLTRVKGNKTSSIKRSLIQFSFTKTHPIVDELVIELSRHNYTSAYRILVKDFYLKM